MNLRRLLTMMAEFIEITFILTSVIVLSYIFVGQLLEVSGDSMFPTFHDKEQLVAEKLSLHYKDPQRGEVVIFEHPDQKGMLLIKRVIGLPKETVTLKNGFIYINGNLLDEPYLSEGTLTEGHTLLKEGIDYRIPENGFLMLGDNRGKSTDSRYWGFINREKILGRGLFVYYPLKNFRFLFGK